MDSTANPTADLTPRRRRWRRVAFVVIILGVLETAGWIGDHLFDFRQKLLWKLTLMEIETEPANPATSSPASNPDLWIRAPDSKTGPEIPYRVGQTTISGAGPWVELQKLTPATCPGTPGQRTFVLGGSAAFGYPYGFEENFADQSDRPAGNPDHRVLNAARVGATSNDIVPIARTILDHYQPTNLVVFAGNNEWFHWRPTPPKNDSEPNTSPQPGPATRSLLATLAHSRALAAVISLLFDLLENNRHHAAPQRITHDDGFVEHHALFGTLHAIDNPLTPDRYDTTGWPETRQKYTDQFRNNLATIVNEAQRRNVRVILMTMPFQYRLAPAWKQRQPLAGDPHNLELMTRLINETVNLYEQKQFDTALKRIQFAIKIDPDTPVPHYLEAQLLESLDRPLEAEAAYARSREAMIGNLGSRLSINRVIREVAAKHNAELVDLRKIFDDFQHQQKRYFNAELIHDDCHPTPLAHGLIAQHLDLILIRP